MAETARAKSIDRVVFSSDELPADLDDRARYGLWHDIYTARFGSIAFARPPDRPFLAELMFAAFGEVGLGRFEGTISRAGRSPHIVAADGSDDFCLLVNRGRAPLLVVQDGREATLAPNSAVLLSDTEPGDVRGAAENAWHALVVPRKPLLDRVSCAEDLAATVLDPHQPAVRHLTRYLTLLDDAGWIEDDPPLVDHIGSTLVDLIGLALGAGRETAALGRGLRSARLAQIVAAIRTGFADPGFSPRTIAAQLHLSPRYIQELLAESGTSFTERVLELRLQKARATLLDRRQDRLRVGEIALLCGFNDISYFNRAFRRRFGSSPLHYRGASGQPAHDE